MLNVFFFFFFCLRSESVAMASGLPDVTTNQEPAEVTEECSGKKTKQKKTHVESGFSLE